MTSKLCLRCGRPFKGRGSFCDDHTLEQQVERRTARQDRTALRIRSGRRWQRARARILRRDDHRCTFGAYPGDLDELAQARERLRGTDSRCTETRRSKLSVHHIEPIERAPELAYDDRNLRTLCTIHHNAIEARLRAGKDHDGRQAQDPVGLELR